MPELRTSNGRVSAYGFACGYIEQAKIKTISLRLWSENGCYHVRAHDFETHGRLFWDSFRLLSGARKRFTVAAGMLHLTAR